MRQAHMICQQRPDAVARSSIIRTPRGGPARGPNAQASRGYTGASRGIAGFARQYTPLAPAHRSRDDSAPLCSSRRAYQHPADSDHRRAVRCARRRCKTGSGIVGEVKAYGQSKVGHCGPKTSKQKLPQSWMRVCRDEECIVATTKPSVVDALLLTLRAISIAEAVANRHGRTK
jgi:hypothetical protein